MSEEFEVEPMEEESDIPPFDTTLYTLQDSMNRFLDTASVDAVYGQAVKDGDNLIIPAAEVFSFAGFGVGMGYGSGGQEKAPFEKGGGGGGGGGGQTFSRPVAVIISSPEGVRVEPVVDVTKISLALFTTLGFMVGMYLRMLNPRRK